MSSAIIRNASNSRRNHVCLSCRQRNKHWTDQCPKYQQYIYRNLLQISLRNQLVKRFNLSLFQTVHYKDRILIDAFTRDANNGYVSNPIIQIISIFYGTSLQKTTSLSSPRKDIIRNIPKIMKGFYCEHEANQILAICNIYKLISIDRDNAELHKIISNDYKPFIGVLIKLIDPSNKPDIDIQYKCLILLEIALKFCHWMDLVFIGNKHFVAAHRLPLICIDLLKTSSCIHIKTKSMNILQSIYQCSSKQIFKSLVNSVFPQYYYDQKNNHGGDGYMKFLNCSTLTLCHLLNDYDIKYGHIIQENADNLFKWIQSVLYHLNKIKGFIKTYQRYNHLLIAIYKNIGNILQSVASHDDYYIFYKMDEYDIIYQIINLLQSDDMDISRALSEFQWNAFHIEHIMKQQNENY